MPQPLLPKQAKRDTMTAGIWDPKGKRNLYKKVTIILSETITKIAVFIMTISKITKRKYTHKPWRWNSDMQYKRVSKLKMTVYV